MVPLPPPPPPPPALSRVWHPVKLSDVSLGARQRYSLVVDEDVKKPNKPVIQYTSPPLFFTVSSPPLFFSIHLLAGAGPVPWTLNAEIYPLWCRSVAASLAAFINWTCDFILSVSFLPAVKTIKIWGESRLTWQQARDQGF